MSANMDHNLFPICSAPSTMPILLVMDRSGAVRYFGTRVKAFRIFFYTRNGTGGRIRLKSSISTYMDHIEFAIPSEPSTMSILLVMDWHLTCKANTFICIELNIPKFNKLSTCSYLPANSFLVIYCNTVPD